MGVIINAPTFALILFHIHQVERIFGAGLLNVVTCSERLLHFRQSSTFQGSTCDFSLRSLAAFSCVLPRQPCAPTQSRTLSASPSTISVEPLTTPLECRSSIRLWVP